MNWADQEALKNMSKRGKPGPRLVRGLIWAVVAIFIISLLVFWAGVEMQPDFPPWWWR